MNFLVSSLIYAKHRLKFLWKTAESLNGGLFRLLYPSFALKAEPILQGASSESLIFSMMEPADIPAVVSMLRSQPEGHLALFAPHDFDEATFRRLLRNSGYLLMTVRSREKESPLGYFFLRAFFTGKAFMGLMVGSEFNGRGIGSEMWKTGAEICRAMGLRMYATVSSHNTASLSSARKGTDVTVKDELTNDYLLIQCSLKEAV